MLLVIVALALAAAAPDPPGLSTSFADDAAIDGARPARDVRKALTGALPKLSACIRNVPPLASADVFIDAQILAAGFFDRAAVFASTARSGDVVDERCVAAALRQISLADRGFEPPTHVVMRLAVRPHGAAPPAGTGPRYVADAIGVLRDELARCVTAARDETPSVDIAGSVIARLRIDASGGVADVDASGGSLPSATARSCIAAELRGMYLRSGPLAGDVRDVDVAWPLFFARPRAPPLRAGIVERGWESPTLFRFLGCGNAFSTH